MSLLLIWEAEDWFFELSLCQEKKNPASWVNQGVLL